MASTDLTPLDPARAAAISEILSASEFSPQARLQALEAEVRGERCTADFAERAMRQLVSAFPVSQIVDARAFVFQGVAVCMRYPRALVARAIDPACGLPSQGTWLSVAHLATYLAKLDSDIRSKVQNARRDRLAEIQASEAAARERQARVFGRQEPQRQKLKSPEERAQFIRNELGRDPAPRPGSVQNPTGSPRPRSRHGLQDVIALPDKSGEEP